MQIDHDGARKAIRGLVYSIEGYRQRMRQDTAPAENSIAERQIDQEQHKLVASWSATPVQLSFATAEEHIGHAQDHLLALQRLLPPPFQVFPICTLARSALEASARAWWLLDPSISARKRVARTMTDRLAGLLHANALEQRLGLEDMSSARIHAIRESARQHDFSLTAREDAIEEELPSITSLVTNLLEQVDPSLGRKAYYDLSNVAHSGLARFLSEERQLPDLVINTEEASESRHIQPLIAGIVIGMASYNRAVTRFFQIYGWNLSFLDTISRQAYHDMRMALGFRNLPVNLIRLREEHA